MEFTCQAVPTHMAALLRSNGRGDPRKAAMWVGTAWHVNSKEVDYKGEIGIKNKLVPTSFLGEATSLLELQRGGADGAAKAPGAAKAAAPVKKAAAVKKAAPKPASRTRIRSISAAT